MRGRSNGEEWYAGGLRFQCQGCGDCCRGPGGYVWVSLDEAKDIAGELNLAFPEFAKTLLRQTTAGLALVDGEKGDCPLLGSDGRCRVYPKRPRQCRAWPWWEENLISANRWNGAAAKCPGMNRGDRHAKSVIDAEKARDF